MLNAIFIENPRLLVVSFCHKEVHITCCLWSSTNLYYDILQNVIFYSSDPAIKTFKRKVLARKYKLDCLVQILKTYKPLQFLR